MVQRRVLVVGTRPASLGDAIAAEAKQSREADRSGDRLVVMRADHPTQVHKPFETMADVYPCDIIDRWQVNKMLVALQPTDIVCCVGINLPDEDHDVLPLNLLHQLNVNCFGPIQLLTCALDFWNDEPGLNIDLPTGANFVAISSNSAHIARSQSAGYCASKAALSMALRSIARNHGGRDGYNIWGYEPGWIVGTPMSDDLLDRLNVPSSDVHPDNVRVHRIPGGHALDKWVLARGIWQDLANPHHAMNGCMIRIDGGEQ